MSSLYSFPLQSMSAQQNKPPHGCISAEYAMRRHLDEVQAHTQKVQCLDLGETGRVMVTGGFDRNVNLWAFGNNKCFNVSFHSSKNMTWSNNNRTAKNALIQIHIINTISSIKTTAKKQQPQNLRLIQTSENHNCDTFLVCVCA